jgi:hypothetical protein
MTLSLRPLFVLEIVLGIVDGEGDDGFHPALREPQ